MYKRPGNIFKNAGYWDRYVDRLTDLRQQLKTYEAMGNWVIARNIMQEIESIERNLEPPYEVTDENRWSFMLKSNKPITKMDTQGN